MKGNESMEERERKRERKNAEKEIYRKREKQNGKEKDRQTEKTRFNLTNLLCFSDRSSDSCFSTYII